MKDNLFALDEALYNSFDCQIVRLSVSEDGKAELYYSNLQHTLVASYKCDSKNGHLKVTVIVNKSTEI